jgi:hypothetical protein
MKSTDHIVPKLNEDVGFYPFNGSEYLVQHNTLKHQVNINQETLQLLNLVDGKRMSWVMHLLAEDLEPCMVELDLGFIC